MFNSLVLLIGLCCLFTTFSNTKEPLSRLIKLNRDSEALSTLIELRNETVETWAIRIELEEKRLMVNEDFAENESCCGYLAVFMNGNIKPLYTISLMKILNLLATNFILFFTTATAISPDAVFPVKFNLILLRTMVMFIPKFSIDKIGRRWLFLVSGVGCSICKVLFATHLSGFVTIRLELMAIIIVFIHVFAALGIEPLHHVYASEAFALDVRNASLAFVSCIEYIGHIVLILFYVYTPHEHIYVLFYSSAPLILILTVLVFISLPETKAKSLRQCRGEFNDYLATHSTESQIHTLGNTYA